MSDLVAMMKGIARALRLNGEVVVEKRVGAFMYRIERDGNAYRYHPVGNKVELVSNNEKNDTFNSYELELARQVARRSIRAI